MIIVSDLNFDRGPKPILRDIDLTIETGGITALIGPNGAGKSTLLSLIARLIPLQSGTIMVDDLQIGACASAALARRLAIMPQANDTAPLLTVRELVGFGRYPYHRGRPNDDDRRRVETALQTFDLLPLAERRLDTLSGGQRQRAQVAMTFAQDTDYILLDEPLNNLDIAASRSLMATLRTLARDHDRTIVVVLHSINYAAAYADRIVAMKEGRIAMTGTPEMVVSEEMLRRVYGTDPRVHRIGGRVLVAV